MARAFDHQVAEFQVSVAVLNGFTALGIPVTKVAGKVCLGTGEVQPSADLCNRAHALRRPPRRALSHCVTHYRNQRFFEGMPDHLSSQVTTASHLPRRRLQL